MQSRWPTFWNERDQLGATAMMISTVLIGLALLPVAFECHTAAAVFGALAFYAVGHGA